jgi:hypothetical protein
MNIGSQFEMSMIKKSGARCSFSFIYDMDQWVNKLDNEK